MGTKIDPSMSKETDRTTRHRKTTSGGKPRLNKQTLQDLSSTEKHTDKVRGGVGKCTNGVSGCGDT